jgi:hypothetical protein
MPNDPKAKRLGSVGNVNETRPQEWKEDHSVKQPFINLESILHALVMIQNDFVQRSQQVISLSVARSHLIRASLIVWGLPLVIGTALLNKQIVETNFTNVTSPVLDFIAFGFFAVAIGNCIPLASILTKKYYESFHIWDILSEGNIF